MPYHVVNLSTNEPSTTQSLGAALPLIFDTGEQAADFARLETQRTGTKHVPRVIADSNWRQREQRLFDRGVYVPLPWIGAAWFVTHYDRDQFAHQSNTDAGMVAFLPTVEHGEQNKHVRLRSGAYLKRYFSNVLTADQIRDLATEFLACQQTHILRLAKTPDEIERVYRHGPRSCMSGNPNDYNSSVHPTRVYGAGDLAIGYIQESRRITARAICWPDKKVYGRIYGDSTRLGRAFNAAEYVPANGRSFLGARLLKINEGHNRYAIPYVDGSYYAAVGDEFLTLTHDSSDMCTCETGGITYYNRVTCARCGNVVRGDEYTVYASQYQTDYWCGRCVNDHAAYSEDEDIYLDRESHGHNVIRLSSGQHMSAWRFARYGATCGHPHCGRNCRRSDLATIRTIRGEESWCDMHTRYRVNGFNYDPDFTTIDSISGRRVGLDSEQANNGRD